MIDKFRIDSHKLIYHVDRVSDWLKGKNIYPIYLEISPSGLCNHRCLFCAYDFVGYQQKFLDTNLLKKRLSEMGLLGVKSILYSGEGEPFLHKDIAQIINHTKRSGIDVAVATNAVLFGKNLADSVLKNLTWLKVSINAGSKKTYAKIHRTKECDFDKVIKNMSYAARIKRKKGYECSLGMQMLLLPENHKEVALLAKTAKDIGMDYLVVKPYSHHPLSRTAVYKNIKYSNYLNLADKLSVFNDEKFSVIFRINTMKKWDQAQRPYSYCSSFSFWAHIDTGGNVWACQAYLGNKNFLYGNIYINTFKEIWNGSKRKKILEFIAKKLDVKHCRINCRMDEANRYLWDLRHPPMHVNFI